MNKEKKTNVIGIIIKVLFGLIGTALLVAICLREKMFGANDGLNMIYDEVNAKYLWVNIVKSAIIIFIALTLYPFIKMIILLFVHKSAKVRTIVDLLLSLLKYITGVVVLMMILSAFGVDTATLVASCGIIALIVGLGCQQLISDVVSGLFIIFEGDFKIGDIVVISGWRGTVESIGIRTTKVMDAVGNIMIINNSNISTIINNTKELSVAICMCGVDYAESLERVELVIAKNLEYIKKRIPAIVEGPFYKGVEELADSAVVIKLVAKCHEEDKFQVQRDMNRELKLIFDKNKVNIPFPQITVNQPVEVIQPKKIRNMDEFVDSQKEASAHIDEKI